MNAISQIPQNFSVSSRALLITPLAELSSSIYTPYVHADIYNTVRQNTTDSRGELTPRNAFITHTQTVKRLRTGASNPRSRIAARELSMLARAKAARPAAEKHTCGHAQFHYCERRVSIAVLARCTRWRDLQAARAKALHSAVSSLSPGVVGGGRRYRRSLRIAE